MFTQWDEREDKKTRASLLRLKNNGKNLLELPERHNKDDNT